MMKNDRGMNSSPLRLNPYLSEKIVSKKKSRDNMTPPSSNSSRPKRKLPNGAATIVKQVLPARRKSTSRTGNRGR